MYHLQTARPVRGRQRLPAHPHRPASARRRRSSRSGTRPARSSGSALDTTTPLAEPERTFLHRYYDAVVVGGEWTRRPYAAALRTPVERVLALGSPRTDVFFDEAAMAAGAGDGCWPITRPWPDAGSSSTRRPSAAGASASGRRPGSTPSGSGRPCRPTSRSCSRPTRTSTRRRPRPTASTSWSTRRADINDLLPATDILITDYSSSVIEFALLRRPIVLLVPDLAEYERDPGLYLDYRTEMIGTQVTDTDGVIDAIATRPVRPDAATTPSSSASSGPRGAGRASASSTTSSAPDPAVAGRGDTLPRDVRHE